LIILKVYVCLPVFNGYDLLDIALTSAENGTLKPDGYYVANNGLEDWVHPDKVIADKTIIYNSGQNLGCSKSWNLFIKDVPQIRIIINNDIEFHSYTIENLVKAYNENQDCAIVASEYNSIGSDETFSCFILTDKGIEEVGLFDEGFTPAYYEDCDYQRRCLLKDMKIIHAPNTGYFHHHCATTHRFTPEQLQSHYSATHKNSVYYVEKWGGMPREETFIYPFNKKPE